MAWRTCCIFDPQMKVVFDTLQNLEKPKHGASMATALKPSPGFIYWRKTNHFYHIFSIWLNSCSEVQLHGNSLRAASLAIKHFLGNTDAKNNIESTMDVVYLLSVHCTGLLAMLTHLNALRDYAANYTIPFFYEDNMVNL